MRLIDADSLKIELIASTELGWEVWGVEEEDIKNAPTIYPIPNDPLTIDQLLEMDGEPVWICDLDGRDGIWALVNLEYALCRTAKGGIAIFDTYGKTWLAYRRRPGEEI